MPDAGKMGSGSRRAGRADADENRGRAVDDETHATQRIAEGAEEELEPDSLAEVGAPRDTSFAGTASEFEENRGRTTGRRETNPGKPDARSGTTGSAKSAPPESEPDSTGSTIPTKRADGSERRGKA